MKFWENVEAELKYQNKTRKQLANFVGFDATTISKGISNQSIPSADVALKISYFLNVSLESLLGLPEKGKMLKLWNINHKSYYIKNIAD